MRGLLYALLICMIGWCTVAAAVCAAVGYPWPAAAASAAAAVAAAAGLHLLYGKKENAK